MRLLLNLLVCMVYSTFLAAQTRGQYIVRAGETLDGALPVEAKYVFPVFKKGTVFLRNGTTSTQQLNYNFLLDEMQFLGIKGDTLTIAEPVTISHVVIDSTRFYYQKFYLREVYQAATFKLGVMQMLVQTMEKKYGGYNSTSAISAISSYVSINNRSSVNRLQARKDVYLEKKAVYYLGDQFNLFVKADKKGFLNFFSAKKNELQLHIRENKINFNNLEDLQKLLQFCTK